MEFQKFRKIPRLSREILISEKIDGTNAQIYICPLREIWNSFAGDYQYQEVYTKEFIDKHCLYGPQDGFYMFAGSRNRWLSVDNGKNCDNYGFARWVKENAEELMKLGEGRHYGEWYGKGIQRNYGLEEKRFALFNVKKWVDNNIWDALSDDSKQIFAPKCCGVVPALYEGSFDTQKIQKIVDSLAKSGSVMVPNFRNPEGIVIYHKASGQLFKKTLENDEKPKG